MKKSIMDNNPSCVIIATAFVFMTNMKEFSWAMWKKIDSFFLT